MRGYLYYDTIRIYFVAPGYKAAIPVVTNTGERNGLERRFQKSVSTDGKRSSLSTVQQYVIRK